MEHREADPCPLPGMVQAPKWTLWQLVSQVKASLGISV